MRAGGRRGEIGERERAIEGEKEIEERDRESMWHIRFFPLLKKQTEECFGSFESK